MLKELNLNNENVEKPDLKNLKENEESKQRFNLIT